MHLDDEDKTLFIMDRGIKYFKTMPFGLKHIGGHLSKDDK
jgi:hypothetical protein